MTAAQSRPTDITSRKETNARKLADEHLDEATASLEAAKSGNGDMKAAVAALCAIADTLQATVQQLDALYEMFNRELPYLTAAIDELAKD